MTPFQTYQQIGAVALAGVQTLAPPAGTRDIWLQAEVADVRITLDGTNPATGTGMLVKVGLAPLLIQSGLSSIKAIAGGAGAILNITFFGSA